MLRERFTQLSSCFGALTRIVVRIGCVPPDGCVQVWVECQPLLVSAGFSFGTVHLHYVWPQVEQGGGLALSSVTIGCRVRLAQLADLLVELRVSNRIEEVNCIVPAALQLRLDKEPNQLR